MDPARLRERLLKRREEIFRFRQGLNESWETVHQPEIEWEETASKEKMAQGLATLDDQDKEEIEAIDASLRKMAEGSYGVCDACGRKISFRRLEAIPWTNLCIRCAGARADKRGTADEGLEEVSSEDLPRERSDEDLLETIADALQTDGRVETDELQISVKEGVVYLEGALPSETKHQILLEIMEDVLGFKEVVDRLKIDELLWEREDRTPLETNEKRTELEQRLQGEYDDDEEDGTSVQPEDKFVPEKLK